MRAFVTCAILAATVMGFSAASAQAYDHWHYYHGRPGGVIVAPVVVVRPAPVIVAPPVVVAPPVYVAPAPVIVGPVIRPVVSLRIGIR